MSASKCSKSDYSTLVPHKSIDSYLERRETSVPWVVMNNSGKPIDVPGHNFEIHVTMRLPDTYSYMSMLLGHAQFRS
jgi:hypothetical protein